MRERLIEQEGKRRPADKDGNRPVLRRSIPSDKTADGAETEDRPTIRRRDLID